MRTTQISWDVTRVLFAVVSIGGLIAASFWIVRPFLPATIWAVMIVVATWPEMRWIEQKLGNRRGIAVTIMTAAMLAIILVPVAIAVTTLIDRADEIAGWTKSLTHFSVPPPPAWIVSLPVVGTKLAARWQEVAAMQPSDLAGHITPHLAVIGGCLLAAEGGLLLLLVVHLLPPAPAAPLYSEGGEAAEWV